MADQRSARTGGSATATRRGSASKKGLEDVALTACQSLERLIGHRTEGVSAVRRSDDNGWYVVVDVLEVARIPDTTSLLASYEVQLDQAGELLEYRRLRRYRRGSADE